MRNEHLARRLWFSQPRNLDAHEIGVAHCVTRTRFATSRQICFNSFSSFLGKRNLHAKRLNVEQKRDAKWSRNYPIRSSKSSHFVAELNLS